MLRYMLLVWNPENQNAQITAEAVQGRLRAGATKTWHCHRSAPGFSLWHDDPMHRFVYPLDESDGEVLGTLFRGGSASADYAVLNNLATGESKRIRETRGAFLVDQYWGRYVGVLGGCGSASIYVIRSPRGGLPCFHTVRDGLHVFFSHMEDCAATRLFRFSVNTQYVAAHLCYTGFLGGSTGINEIRELAQGERVRVDPSGHTEWELLWNPAKICTSSARLEPAEAERSIRNVTQKCVWAEAALHPRILHHLSGGLDSAIVLACLRKAPSNPTVVCMNLYDDSPLGDERHFARLSAEAARCRLIEIEHLQGGAPFETLATAACRPCPGAYMAALHYGRAERRIANEWELGAVFDGSGGDQLFYNLESELVAADYLRARGPNREFVTLCASIARITGQTVYSVLGRSIRRRFSNRESILALKRTYSKLLTPQVINQGRPSTDLLHPWLRDMNGVPLGKRYQIQMLTIDLDPYDLTGESGDLVHIAPLLSQPLVECCLRIPSFVLSPHGQSRAAVRRAFVDRVPQVVIERTSKGIVDSFLREALQSNKEFLRSFILDGRLVELGMLDRTKVERLLADETQLFSEQAPELIYDYLDVETWLRSVENRAVSNAVEDFKHGDRTSDRSSPVLCDPLALGS
ncbi:MAG TPA: asparagine synthase C-terminal domain-containing protein [Terriglobales bacterium]|nr:asparagine synthase C-terminal domain-containing protein [Terriglobales bacterium]